MGGLRAPAACLVAVWLTAASAGYGLSAARADEPKAPAGAAADRATTQKVCGRCHNIEVVLDAPKSDEEWQDTVQLMVDRGARGTDADFAGVMRFLRANATTVNVNSAAPEDLEYILGLTPAAARAVAERRARRPLRDLSDLASVPGVDPQALGAKSRRIYF